MLRFKMVLAALVVLALGCVGVIASLTVQDQDGAGAHRPEGSPKRSATGAAGHPDGHDFGSPGVPEDAEEGRVVRLVDGDTIEVAALDPMQELVSTGGTTVRLLEFDTPESVDPGSPVQCYAKRATRYLTELIPVGSRIWVTRDDDLLDPYGRTLLYVWSEDGAFVNQEMVRSGHAKAVLYEPNDEYISLLRRMERQARAAERGLWGACEFFGQPVMALPRPSQTPSPYASLLDDGLPADRAERLFDAQAVGDLALVTAEVADVSHHGSSRQSS